MNTKTATKRRNENSHEQQQTESVKRARLSSRPTDDNTNRIVLRIRKPSEDLPNSRSETSNSNHITVQVKETLKEDNDNQDQSNVFDISNQTLTSLKNENE